MPDPGQRQRFLAASREFAAVTRHDLLRGAMQIARPAVIAETGPRAQHGVEPRSSERVDCREARQEPAVIRKYRRDPRLLQHDFGDPHAVGIARPAPVEVTLRSGEPAEQLRLKRWQLGRWNYFGLTLRCGRHQDGHRAIVARSASAGAERRYIHSKKAT